MTKLTKIKGLIILLIGLILCPLDSELFAQSAINDATTNQVVVQAKKPTRKQKRKSRRLARKQSRKKSRRHGRHFARTQLKYDYIPDTSDAYFMEFCSNALGVELDSTSNKHFIRTLVSWIGAPYRYGGITKQGTDCSGFVSSVYKEVYNMKLTHGGATMLADMKRKIAKGKPLQEGDILFFKRGRRITHVAIYLKDNKFIHAATERRGVVIDDLRGAYYRRGFFVAGSPFKTNDGVVIGF